VGAVNNVLQQTAAPRPPLKGLPGSMVGTHYHVGTVHGYTMRGHWRYLEHDWVAKPGTYIYEPAGEAHTLVITEDSPEPMMTMFVVEAASSIWTSR
jgi:2,4'-dihydroxyacetophenone dioxygenase